MYIKRGNVKIKRIIIILLIFTLPRFKSVIITDLRDAIVDSKKVVLFEYEIIPLLQTICAIQFQFIYLP